MAAHFQDETITIQKIQCGPYGNNAYILVCPQTNESIVIDAPPDPGAMIEAARQTDVKVILITHNHFDHIEGLPEVKEALGAPVAIGAADADGLPEPPDICVEDGDEITARIDHAEVDLHARAHRRARPASRSALTCLRATRCFRMGRAGHEARKRWRMLLESVSTRLFTLDHINDFYPGHGDDGNLATEKGKYDVFASKSHPADLEGDVDWLNS